MLSGLAPDPRVVVVALLYGIGAHGIMTLNDFKSIEGDRRFGLRSLPVMLGVERAALVACLVMAAPQAVVAALLLAWGAAGHRRHRGRAARAAGPRHAPLAGRPARARALV